MTGDRIRICPELRVWGSGAVLPGNTWWHVNVKFHNSITEMSGDFHLEAELMK